MTTLHSRLTAAATALALALGSLTASTAPASALGSRDEKALGWIIGLGATALILNEMSKDQSRPRAQPAPRGPQPWGQGSHRRDDNRRDARMTVPGNCLIAVRTHNGRREVVSGRCASEVMGRNALPRSCAFDLITNRGGRPERVYGRNCLEDNGYRIGRR